MKITELDGKIRYEEGDLKTNWMSPDDSFRLRVENLNPDCRERHLSKEIEIRNVLDEGIAYLNKGKYPKAIACFDEVLFYDSAYCDALISKSHALYGQGHYVKALRFYRRAVKAGASKDDDYYRRLLDESRRERDSFPKIKSNIYAGDEAASQRDYLTALNFYDKALVNPSKFKKKILYKLLNKKACVLINLNRFDEALASFDVSLRVHENDLAYFGKGYCQYRLGMDCHDSLLKAQRIEKSYLLKKAMILKELGYDGDALSAADCFLDNHFTPDDDYYTALKLKSEL